MYSEFVVNYNKRFMQLFGMLNSDWIERWKNMWSALVTNKSLEEALKWLQTYESYCSAVFQIWS